MKVTCRPSLAQRLCSTTTLVPRFVLERRFALKFVLSPRISLARAQDCRTLGENQSWLNFDPRTDLENTIEFQQILFRFYCTRVQYTFPLMWSWFHFPQAQPHRTAPSQTLSPRNRLVKTRPKLETDRALSSRTRPLSFHPLTR
jgi:hypothetical protein